MMGKERKTAVDAAAASTTTTTTTMVTGPDISNRDINGKKTIGPCSMAFPWKEGPWKNTNIRIFTEISFVKFK